LDQDRFLSTVNDKYQHCDQDYTIPREAKKLHRFIFAIALRKLQILRWFLANIYVNKFPINPVFHILYLIRDGEPA